MNKEFSIQKATIEDIEGICELYKGLSEFIEILPKEVCKPVKKVNLIKYFNGENNSKVYFIAKSSKK